MKRAIALLALLLAAPAARADWAFPAIRLDFGTTPPTSCRPMELFVDTDVDTNGALCICRAVNTWKCSPVALMSHASSHQNGGGDEISVAGLSGLLGDPQLAGTLDDAQNTPIDTADTPADGDLLKYDSASGKARWAPAGSASFSTLSADYGDETVTSVWDLSGAQLELPNSTAPTGTDCDNALEAGRVHVDTNAATGQQLYVCEGVSGWVKQGGDPAATAPYNQYDPDNPPASCAECEEWTGNTAALSWAWGNQDAATETLEMDGALLNGNETGTDIHARWLAAPGSGDFVVTAKLSVATTNTAGDDCGIALLITGTTASPTLYHQLRWTTSSSTAVAYFHQSTTSGYASTGSTTVGTIAASDESLMQTAYHWLQWRYTDSGDALTSWFSLNGKTWQQIASTTAAQPLYWGYIARRNAACRFDYIRRRTDAAGLAGQVGE